MKLVEEVRAMNEASRREEEEKAVVEEER